MVELVRAGRKPEFESSGQAIRDWGRQSNLDEGRHSDGLTSQEREELRRLQREIANCAEIERYWQKPLPPFPALGAERVLARLLTLADAPRIFLGCLGLRREPGELRMPQSERLLALRPVGIEVIDRLDFAFRVVQKGLRYGLAHPEGGEVGASRPPEVMRPEVGQAGKSPQLLVRLLQRGRVDPLRTGLPEERPLAADLQISTVEDLAHRPTSGTRKSRSIFVPRSCHTRSPPIMTRSSARTPAASLGRTAAQSMSL